MATTRASTNEDVELASVFCALDCKSVIIDVGNAAICVLCVLMVIINPELFVLILFIFDVAWVVGWPEG